MAESARAITQPGPARSSGAPPLVRVSKKPDFRNWEAVLFRLWEDRLILLAPEKLEPGAVLAIQMPGDPDSPGPVVVGRADRIALREDRAWLVSCTLRQPLPRKVVHAVPTLFAMLCESKA